MERFFLVEVMDQKTFKGSITIVWNPPSHPPCSITHKNHLWNYPIVIICPLSKLDLAPTASSINATNKPTKKIFISKSSAEQMEPIVYFYLL